MKIFAKVTSVNRNNWEVKIQGGGFLKAKINNRYKNHSLPIVGDNVECEIDSFGNIFILNHQKRKNILKRQYNGKEQLIASNIDVVFIVTSLNKEFSITKLERLITIGLMTKAKLCLLLTKIDLCNDIEYFTNLLSHRFPSIDFLEIDALHGYGVQNLYNFWNVDETAIFIGSSGVGKSTLINKLLNKETMKTNSIREKDCKGKHTTTVRQLLVASDNRLIIDTPGIRSVLVTNDNNEVDQIFSNILELEKCCKYTNCNHSVSQDGCAIQLAIKNGILDMDTYCRYLKIKKKKENLDIFLNGHRDMKTYEKIQYCKLKKKERRH
ncbi:MAG: ribosome small subunit-dependent GTPase A [Christensenellales bacterium]